MTRRLLRTAALVAALAASASALAQECASDVSNAQNVARSRYIEGMAGLASNNFSARPGTFSSMGCLSKFMQGNMDTFFKPPQLSDLLQSVLNMACNQAVQSVTAGIGGAGGANLLGLLGSVNGGGGIGQALGIQGSSSYQSGGLQGLYRR